jgi:fructose-bisphosphate aldolase class I
MTTTTELNRIALQMVSGGKGILAADESSPTLSKRFQKLGIESTEESRRQWREMLFSAPSLSSYISGTILYDETFNQSFANGKSFPDALIELGILPGIKVDTGAKDLQGFPGETVTEGLDGLGARLENYRSRGARFAKWRAVITIGDNTPTTTALVANAHALARYAKLCQQNDIVPIVEPEVLMNGTHTIQRSFRVTRAALLETFEQLALFDVVLDEMVLKPSMVISGDKSEVRASEEEVAINSVECYRQCVPAAVAGIALLSGGQPDSLATSHLNKMNSLYKNLPWPITFSYGRGLQDEAMSTWLGDPSNATKAQAALLKHAEANFKAARGEL